MQILNCFYLNKQQQQIYCIVRNYKMEYLRLMLLWHIICILQTRLYTHVCNYENCNSQFIYTSIWFFFFACSSFICLQHQNIVHFFNRFPIFVFLLSILICNLTKFLTNRLTNYTPSLLNRNRISLTARGLLRLLLLMMINI